MSNDTRKLNIHGKLGIVNIFFWLIFNVLLLFGSAGTLYWVRGWIFFCYRLSYQIFYISILMIVNPQLLNERGNLKLMETKRYDKYFLILSYILLLSMLVVAGLDVRFQWSSIPFITIYPSIVAVILTSFIALWAQISNSHFILTSRNDKLCTQQVCTIGPYRYIRHPGYLCAVIQWICYPFILGSLFSFIPALILMSFYVIRTYYEDETLKKELKGYEEYSKTTKFRLFPYLW